MFVMRGEEGRLTLVAVLDDLVEPGGWEGELVGFGGWLMGEVMASMMGKQMG